VGGGDGAGRLKFLPLGVGGILEFKRCRSWILVELD
jgi:hypothetical protein